MHALAEVDLERAWIADNVLVGVLVRGAHLTIRDSDVRGTTSGPFVTLAGDVIDDFGHGLVAAEAADMRLTGVRVQDNATYGVIFEGSLGLLQSCLVSGHEVGLEEDARRDRRTRQTRPVWIQCRGHLAATQGS